MALQAALRAAVTAALRIGNRSLRLGSKWPPRRALPANFYDRDLDGSRVFKLGLRLFTDQMLMHLDLGLLGHHPAMHHDMHMSLNGVAADLGQM